MFLERINERGMANNKYWYSRAWNRGAGTVNAMPNCTTGCIGFTYENSAPNFESPYTMFIPPYQTPGAFPEAKDWYKMWKLDKGVEPKIGGVAVWGDSKSLHGHVAYVLETRDAGKSGAWIKVCQSNYKGTYFEVKEYTVKKGVITPGVGMPYIGCCYTLVKDLRTSRDYNKVQVEVLTDSLNVRNKPNGVVYSGRRCPKGIYNVYDRAKEGDYTWAKLEDNFWIALNDKDGWTRTYEIETLEKRFQNLANAYQILSEKYSLLVLKYQQETGKTLD